MLNFAAIFNLARAAIYTVIDIHSIWKMVYFTSQSPNVGKNWEIMYVVEYGLCPGLHWIILCLIFTLYVFKYLMDYVLSYGDTWILPEAHTYIIHTARWRCIATWTLSNKVRPSDANLKECNLKPHLNICVQ